MDLNRTLRDAEFKDERPLKTVEKIKALLESYGIKTKERWNESGVPYCYSIRITVESTGFGVNGKGLTKEFALASGYGELMERLQFGFIGSLGVQKEAVLSDRETARHKVSVQQLLKENGHWYQAMTDRLYAFTGHRESPEDVLARHADTEGNVSVLQYYNLSKNKREWFPYALHGIYTTNGAAAGNTMEEALVQGISETVERYHKIRIIHEGLAMPDIPESVLKKCKIAHNIISYIRRQGFKVIVKDASLGTKFPVVCTVFINEHTGKYHTHFGAYPVFEIALERALTESFQGRNIENIAKFEQFHYDRSQAYAVETLTAELVRGTAQKHIDFFVGTPSYPYNEKMGFTGKNNRELLRECLDFLQDLGFEVLARDRSSLGFPAYQVLIPGYSECAIHRLSSHGDEGVHQQSAIRVLRNAAAASAEDLQGMCEYVKLQNSYGKMTLGGGAFAKSSMLAVKLPETLDEQLMSGALAYAYYGVGDYKEAARYVDRIIAVKQDKAAEYLTCVKRYFMMKAYDYTEEQIKAGLEFFHQPKSCSKLFACIKKGINPMEEYTLHCDDQCTFACPLYGLCRQKNTRALSELIREKIGQMHFEDFEAEIKKFLD